MCVCVSVVGLKGDTLIIQRLAALSSSSTWFSLRNAFPSPPPNNTVFLVYLQATLAFMVISFYFFFLGQGCHVKRGHCAGNQLSDRGKKQEEKKKSRTGDANQGTDQTHGFSLFLGAGFSGESENRIYQRRGYLMVVTGYAYRTGCIVYKLLFIQMTNYISLVWPTESSIKTARDWNPSTNSLSVALW